MTLFSGIATKIKYWKQGQKELHLKGINSNQWCLLAGSYFSDLLFDSKHLIICSSNDEAEDVFESLKHLKNVYFYPGLNQAVYSSIMSSERSLLQRWAILHKILDDDPLIVVTTLEGALLWGPNQTFFKNCNFSINKEDIISPFELSQKLVSLGYSSSSTVEEPGTFSRRGEIFDIFPISHPPIRLQYFDDLIEEIFEIDLETQKTIRSRIFNKISFIPGPGFLCKDPYASQLRSNIPQVQPVFKKRYENRNQLFRQINDGQLFENYPIFAPLFFNQPETILDYLQKNSKITFINFDDCQKNFQLFLDSQREDYELIAQDIQSSILLPPIEKIFQVEFPENDFKTLLVDELDTNLEFNSDLSKNLYLNLESLKNFFQTKILNQETKPLNKYEFIKNCLRILKNELKSNGQLIVCYKSENARTELEFLLEENKISEFKDQIHYTQGKLNEGFYYKNENIFCLSEADFFSPKKKKAKNIRSNNNDLFAEQISTLKINDFVIHRDFGIGLYKGIETIEVGEQKNDFLILVYEDGDKVYVPVYKLNLIQKHADSSSPLKVASLKSKKFSELRQKARNSVKKLAIDLIRLQAERKLKGGYSFSPPEHLYREFELSFAYEETPDQEKAILEVLEDMQAPSPMDRLVCGDVGFGKTEVAMRAAMKAVLDKKQVVLLVPTTVLALQHFHSFVKRYENFPVNINFISRFKNLKQKKEIIAEVAEGKIDILIGTHAILSEKLNFHDLGLLIIDEEHRFGVAHKEKLKALKTGIDVLTMTATPIPRTLQLSFLGIRDLSLIKTAPPRRQSIKTHIIKEDDLTLKSAIEKELSRGGQIYYVHNRVHDIEEHELYLNKLVPQARVCITHGQMNEKDLEARINDFYEHKYDILLTTTIIESGIDIPNANTIIISRADTFGLAQLHQLRGRIGRSDRKAYAYFIVPDNKILTETASKRLQALQTYAEMGAGFALASSDMEIRGAGDILGAEQSGHIEAIGLEFYMDLLQEAIHELKGEQYLSIKNVEIQAPFAAFIPNSYISDQSIRLKQYKRLSNCVSMESLENIISELYDGYGVAPKELEALYAILKSRIIFRNTGIKLVKISGSQVHLFFEQEILNRNHQLRDKMLQTFLNKPKLYKLNPDSSVIAYFKESITPDVLSEFAKHIAAQISV